MHTPETESQAALFLFMSASHRAMERAYEQLAAALRAGDRDAIHAHWVDLESQMLAHFEAEERYILPALAKADRDTAVGILRDHGQFRERILELGIAVELHQVRMHMVDELAATLRAHAAREEELMYRWATTRLAPRLASQARSYVENALHFAR